jgi:hypothetical protein
LATKELDPMWRELRESQATLSRVSEDTRGIFDEKMRDTVKNFLHNRYVLKGKKYEEPPKDMEWALLQGIGALTEKMFNLEPSWRDPEVKRKEVMLQRYVRAIFYLEEMVDIVPSENLMEFLRYSIGHTAEDTIRRYELIKGWAESNDYNVKPSGFKAPIKGYIIK